MLENYWAKFLNFFNDGLPVDAPQPIMIQTKPVILSL